MAFNLIKKFKDQQAFNRLKSRDTSAFIKVYDQYASDLYRFIYFKVNRKEEAQDLTSMVFLKAWQHIQNNSLNDSKTLRALIYKIARHAIIDYYREGRAKIESLDDEHRPVNIIDDHQDLAADLDQNFALNHLYKLLKELKEEYREIIVLKFINDLDLEEIADVTGKSKGNVRVTLHRALNTLKEMIKVDEKSRLKL